MEKKCRRCAAGLAVVGSYCSPCATDLVSLARRSGLRAPDDAPLKRLLPVAMKYIATQKNKVQHARRRRELLARVKMRQAKRAALGGQTSKDVGPRQERLLSAAEVADRLAVSKPTVYRLIARGRLRSKKIGAAVRVHASALETYLRER